jgi:5,6,7,8-tetrahydromethanopterin hydro-lyase
MTVQSMLIGEGFVGSGANAAHVNVVIGHRDGPVGTAWATSLATPRQGFVPFVAVAQPGVPIVPMTLFVNKAEIANELHGNLTWGAAQAGLAAGTGLAHERSLFATNVNDLVMIAAMWINPSANNEEEVFANNRDAAASAIEMAFSGGPASADAMAAMLNPANPYFRIS